MARSENNLNAVFTDTAKAIQDAEQNWDTKICPRNFATHINNLPIAHIANAPHLNLYLDFDSAGTTFYKWYTAVTYSQGNPGTRPEVGGSVWLDNIPEALELAYARVRGNWSVNYKKKSLKLKCASKVNLLGLNNGKKAKDWLLLANYNDNSGLRNALGFYMGQLLFKHTDQWAPTFTWVHVYVNNDYLGLYLLCDQKEVNESRININEPKKTAEYPEGYPGTDVGYFFERDDYWNTYFDIPEEEKDPGFMIEYPTEYFDHNGDTAVLPINNSEEFSHSTSPKGSGYGVNFYHGSGAVGPSGAAKVDYYTIHSNIYSQDQIDFLKERMQLIYAILYEACKNNPVAYEIDEYNNLVPSQLTPQEAVAQVIDLDSFVNMIILCELSGDPDLAHTSFFFTLDMSATGDKKLKLNCPWDFDRAFGSCDGLSDASYSTLWCAGVSYNPWVALLSNAPWNFRLAKARWEELIQEEFMQKCLNFLDLAAYFYEEDFARDNELYPVNYKYNGQTDPNIINMANMNSDFYQGFTTEYEAKEKLRNWLEIRINAVNTLCQTQLYPFTYYNNNKTMDNILASQDWLNIDVRYEPIPEIIK